MANFTALKTAINNAIKTNGNEEITGAVLQVILDAMVETLGESAITNLENALAAEVTNRENAVGSVASDLTAEALARANKDNQLDGRINQEEYNRANADAALSRTIDQGFQTLNSQMTALNAAISALNAAYQNGFLYGGVVTPSSSPANGKCFYIALQGGTYTNFGGVGVVQGINILKNDNGWKVEHIYDQTTLLNEFYLLRQQVIQAITSFTPIVIEGDVTNAPDEEDLTSDAQNLLKFKDRAYSPLNFSGMGMKILRKNIAPLSDSAAFNGFVEGVTAEETLAGTPELIFWDRMNTRFVGIKDGVYYLDWTDSDNYVPVSTSLVYMYNGTPYQWTGSDFIVDETEVPNLVNCLTQDMINEANTVYIIRYDFTLREDITIPEGCVLQFDGGSISGEFSLTGTNTCIEAGLVKIFGLDVIFEGTWNVTEGFAEWFANEDTAISIAKVWKITNICRLLERKTYIFNTTLDIPTYKVLKGCCANTLQSYEGQIDGGSPKILTNIAPAIMLYCGGSIEGLTIDTNISILNSDYIVGIQYKDTAKGILGNPDGTYIRRCTIENTNNGSIRSIDNAAGIGIKFTGESYHVNIIDSCIRYFNYALYSLNMICYISNIVNTRTDYCRHIARLYRFVQMNINLTCQGDVTTIQQGTDEPLIEIVSTTGVYPSGYLDARLYDYDGDRDGYYKFENILSLPGNTQSLYQYLILGENIRFHLGRSKIQDFPSVFNFNPNKSGYNLNAGGNENAVNSAKNLFYNRRKDADYTFSKSDGISTTQDIEKIFGIYSGVGDRRFSYTAASDLDYIELYFAEIKAYLAQGNYVNQFNSLYDINSIFNATNRTPKAVLYTLTYHTDSDVVAKILVYNETLTISQIKETYASIIDEDTYLVKASHVEFFVHDLVNIVSSLAFLNNIKSVNIRMYGAIATNKTVILNAICGTPTIEDTANIFTKSNRWRGEQGFDNFVISRGNQGSTRPTGLTIDDAGTPWFDKNLSPARPIWWSGTGWVDATGATV